MGLANGIGELEDSWSEWGTTLQLDKSFLENATEIGIASVIIHEIIHMEMHWDLYTSTGKKGAVNITDFNNSSYPSYKAIYDKYFGTGFIDYHHEFMALYRRDKIIDALSKYDKDILKITDRSGKVNINGKEIKYSSAQFYEALSWGGLQGTKAYENLSYEDKALFQAIRTNEKIHK